MWKYAVVCLLVISPVTGTQAAIERLPKEPGFSGFVLFGGGYAKLENNLLAGNDLIDIGNEQISSLTDAPESDSSPVPAANFDLRYTFSNLRTQLFWGNRMVDFLRFDVTIGIGVRQMLGKSILEVAVVQPPVIQTQMWSDPYAVGVDRTETDVDLDGLRVTWDRIGGSGLAFRALYRDYELDDETSGTFLGLSPTDRALLSRDGETLQLTGVWSFRLSDRHILAPEIQYHDFDYDGEAMAYDGYQAEINYAYNGSRAAVVLILSHGEYENKAANPIYGVTDEFDRTTISITTFIDLFGKRPTWNAYAILAHGESDHDIDFYDTKSTTATVGAVYRW